MAAARELLAVSPAQLPNREAQALGAALGEWQASLGNRLDYPETHLVIGGAALVLRDTPSALAAFRRAVTLDPQLAQGWSMLIRINAATGDMAAARAAATEATAALPDDPGIRDLAQQLQ
jgi:tetratricopeptide (TPR) repeat protein